MPICVDPFFLIPYIVLYTRLYSSRKLFGRTRRNNNDNDCEIKAAYAEIKTILPRFPAPVAWESVFSFYINDRNTLALFFPHSFFRSVPVNTFASTIDGIRRTLTVVNGETLNAILNRAIVNNRRCSVNRLEMGQNNLRREIVNETSVPESIVNVDLSLGCPISAIINKTFIY